MKSKTTGLNEIQVMVIYSCAILVTDIGELYKDICET